MMAKNTIVGGNLESTVFRPEDLYLFHEGTLYQSYKIMGAQPEIHSGKKGVRFTVWAPNAREVRLASDFNGWDGRHHPLEQINRSGLWTLFMEGLAEGTLYKYEIITAEGEKLLKADPYAFQAEVRPRTASVVRFLEGYRWSDRKWQKRLRPVYDRPLNIYEVHLGTWRQKKDGTLLTYRELAEELLDYVQDMGYTHIELMPLTEHPYDLSWGYQATGYYAVTSRFGSPHDFMYFVDECHRREIGVILDWVPAHFAKDAHGLRRFDGSALFEHEDALIAEKPGWGTLGFDYSKPEVCSFLISNALFWLDVYHIDGLRIDAVTSMLLRDFEKQQWRPNKDGGKEDLEAIAFIKKLNETVFEFYPNALMMAEESSAWAQVTGPTDQGGLGFNYKWNMGWMNDTLKYFELDPIYRAANQSLLTFPIAYAYEENFCLPLSHDEVVHGKKSLLNKMPGTYEQKFAGLRALLGYWMSFPGKKLLFMGGEFGQFIEWKDTEQLDWLLLDYEMHRKLQSFSRKLNHLYIQEKSLWQLDHTLDGYQWIDHQDHLQNIIVYMRKGKRKGEQIIVICNFAPVQRDGYRIGVPSSGSYEMLLNSDDPAFGGEGVLGEASLEIEKVPWHGHKHSLELTLPPMSVIWLKKGKKAKK
ncbi:1,4-alpha-glucan branching protein GlgB [Paenibacillus abyssi]|uniref:1,4-alpha-glucan branching enzyme GlgB n=1 Tax=Paenibacillus abyssi TaxID=1340531 RepID=A0A917D571_9BACL|nr:1,4-alpha-glucan branching protein GlgB [Paenibacillus abyssi]GGG09040.1 1,4-alpha-glucan branching enzyme [Paenibacillus abyssi]